jgi:N-methylhydantoinase B
MTCNGTLDAVDVAITWDRLISIADEGAAALVRSSFSTLVRESLDLSVMLFDASGRMIAQSTKCIPVFIGTAPVTMAHMLAKYPPATLRPGDVVVSNDPVIGTGHMFDIAVMRPVFLAGAIIGYAMSITHLPDIGGMGFSVAATEIFHEGLRLPIWKLFDAGRLDENLVALIRLNVRVPDQVMGDIMANVSCVEVVGDKLVEFLAERRMTGLEDVATAILSQTEAAVRQAIFAIPDGSYTHTLEVEAMDQVRRLACRIDKWGDAMLIDFAGTGPCVAAGINVPLSYTRSMALYTVKCLTTPRLPNNDGATQPITVAAPVGCILNAVPPAPSAGRHTIGHFVMPLLFGAFAEALPERVTAESGLMNILTLHGHLADGSAMSATYFASGGFGGMRGLDGRATTPGSSNMGGTPIEMLEPLTGLVVERKALRLDSGGAGQFRGGAGQDVVLRNDTGHAMTVFSMANRTRFPAQGLGGGRPGAARAHLVNDVPIATQGRHVLAPGDRLLLREAGGGGYGPAMQRDPQAVRNDVLQGTVSVEAALRDHNVRVAGTEET